MWKDPVFNLLVTVLFLWTSTRTIGCKSVRKSLLLSTLCIKSAGLVDKLWSQTASFPVAFAHALHTTGTHKSLDIKTLLNV